MLRRHSPSVLFVILGMGWLVTVTATAILAHAGPLFEPAVTPVPFTIDIGNRKQLFLDDLLIVEASGICIRQGNPTKYVKNPILQADKPWEGCSRPHGVSTATGILYDEEDKVFKMWYGAQERPDIAPQYLAYAVSKDGYDWEKPNLGRVEFHGSRDNNICMETSAALCLANVIKTPHDPDPSRRYKGLGELEPLDKPVRFHGEAVGFSPDGLEWTLYEDNPVVHKGPNMADGGRIFGWDPLIQKYVAYFRPGRPLIPQWVGADHICTIGYSTSTDFIHWSPTRVMLAPDEKDDGDVQYHYFNSSLDGEFYVGLLALHRLFDQTLDLYLLSSRDGFHWTWVDRQRPFLARGEKGSYDAGWLMPITSVVHGNKIFIFYLASAGVHILPCAASKGNTPFVPTTSIALATLPVDRYVGLLAGPRPGFVATRSITFQGSKLKVDFDAAQPQSKLRPGHSTGASVRVAVLDPMGNPIRGFGIDQCKPMYESGVHEVSWGDAGLRTLQGKRIRLRFELRRAALYSFQFQ